MLVKYYINYLHFTFHEHLRNETKFSRKRRRNKRQRVDECIIHCSDETGDLVSLKDLESWKTLLNAAVIRNLEGILSIAKTLKEGEIPRISYHRKCRSIFTLKRDLKKLSQSVIQVQEQGDTSSRRSSI